MYRTNVEGTREVMAAAKDCGVAAVVHVSSAAALFDPALPRIDESTPLASGRTVYARTKVAADRHVRELIDAFDQTDADDDVRAVIITGEGRAFCAGADLGKGGETFARGGSDVQTDAGVPRDGGGTIIGEGDGSSKSVAWSIGSRIDVVV